MRYKFPRKTGRLLASASLATGFYIQPALADVNFPANGTTTQDMLGQFDITVNQNISLAGIWLNAGDILRTPILEDTGTQISTSLTSNPNVVDTQINNLDLSGQNTFASNYQVFDNNSWKHTNISGSGTNIYAGDIANTVNSGEYAGTAPSLGTLTSNYGNGTLPATSQFAQNLDIALPGLPAGDYLYTINPLTVTANTNQFPTFSDSGLTPYTSSKPTDLYLYENPTDSIKIGTISAAQEAMYSSPSQTDFTSFQANFPAKGPQNDYMTTPAGGTFVKYDGQTIQLQGLPIGAIVSNGTNYDYGQTDTIVERLSSAIPQSLGSTVSTAIQFQTVQLESTGTINTPAGPQTVYALLDRTNPQPNDPPVSVNGIMMSPNTMAITAGNLDASKNVTGGTYNAYLNFNVQLYVGGHIVDSLQNGQVVAQDVGGTLIGTQDINLQGKNISWSSSFCATAGSCSGTGSILGKGNDFFPGIDPNTQQVSVLQPQNYTSFSQDESHAPIIITPPPVLPPIPGCSGSCGPSGFSGGVSSTPEPEEWLMLLSGMTVLGFRLRSEKRQANVITA